MNPLHALYGIIGLAVVSGVGWYIYDCESTKTDYAVFKSNVELLGKKAKADAENLEAQDKLAKEKADAENKTLRSDNAALAKRLRDARSRSGRVPEASPTARRPDLITLDRAELRRTLEYLDERGSGIAEESDQGRIDLNTAKTWAQGRQ